MFEGSIGSVTARIPWPNPLTGTVGASVQSLHVVFHVIPSTSEAPSFSPADLADSVVSVAESFIHEELSPREEATLLESFHPDLAASVYDPNRNIPGSMDPFLQPLDDEEYRTDTDPAGVSIFATLIERLLARFEFDATDTEITLVHPGHASFTFSIAELRYGTEGPVVLPGTLESKEIVQVAGETRKMSISGIAVTARNLRPPPLPSHSSTTLSHSSPASPLTPVSPSQSATSTSPSYAYTGSHSAYLSLPGSPHVQTIPHSTGPESSYHSPEGSPASSSSSLDEDTTMFMSQSLVELPPRPVSPSGSMASSMYQSAISLSHQEHTEVDDSSRSRTPSPMHHRQSSGVPIQDWQNAEPEFGTTSQAEPQAQADSTPDPRPTSSDLESPPDLDELMLSFGEDPIVIRLTTPRLTTTTPETTEGSSPNPSSPSSLPSPRFRDVSPIKQSMQLTVSAGVIACAFRAWHIRSLLGMLSVWESHNLVSKPTPSSAAAAPSTSGPNIFSLGLEASLKVRAVVILLLASTESGIRESSPQLADFYARPLFPPLIFPGCVRIFFDSISASGSLSTSSKSGASALLQTQGQSVLLNVIEAAFLVEDVSAFVLTPTKRSGEDETKLSASPVLITDPNLAAQYPVGHSQPNAQAVLRDQQTAPKLPEFHILDWTDEQHSIESVKLSTWRTKARSKPSKRRESHGAREEVPTSPSTVTGDEITTHVPAISIRTNISFPVDTVKTRRHTSNDNVEVTIVPIHVFVDLGSILGSKHGLAFLDELADDINNHPTPFNEAVLETDDDETPYHTPAEIERQRLERLVLEDLDLDLNYLVREPPRTFHQVPTTVAPLRKVCRRMAFRLTSLS